VYHDAADWNDTKLIKYAAVSVFFSVDGYSAIPDADN